MAWTGVGSEGFVLRNRGGWKSTWSLSETARVSRPKPKPKFTIGNETESISPVLVSRPKPKFTIGNETESPASMSPVLTSHPPTLRRRAVAPSPNRRWTLAMALTDDGISDELLVEKLEALRSRSRAGSVAASDADDPADWDRVWAACNDELDADDDMPPPPPLKDALYPISSSSSMPALPTQPTASWQSARRALLTCRELVRTERHYLTALQRLIAGDTRAAPPPLMQTYAAALARESAAMLRRMEHDPSAWGVSVALLGAEDALDAAFVAWCGIVGEWFVNVPQPQPRRLSKTRSRVVSDYGGDDEEAGTAKRRPWRHSSLGASARASSALSLLSLSSEPPSPMTSTFAKPKSRRENDARPTVRDLAIVPTQRLMRYVLLYRDLLEHTPEQSPARALVAQAVEVALRIAQRCDRAQGNAAFLKGGGPHARAP
ncbi:hypothetical protein GGX14DRAFT_379115 [Mycena pura]|uniref:DH domain-containing protein n=1 Tax=Mycena pura TaxID=153505 RepID=A0AAD6URQ9_9AGAR|nr:hypothetical protein GGX14DRAFT_379115 [Mycena pura]